MHEEQSEEERITDKLDLFAVKIEDKISGQTLYINFRASSEIEYPKVDITEEAIVRATLEQNPDNEELRVPVLLGAIYWRTHDNKINREYVIDAEINDKFALRDVVNSEFVTNFVVHVTASCIEQKFNGSGQTNDKRAQQFIGHKLDLDLLNFELLKSPLERTNEIVHNRVLFVESDARETLPVGKSNDINDDVQYDLFLRPTSRLLTCSLETDKCPESINFNNDRICIEAPGGKVLVDTHLPLEIDLREPMKYKYDDRLCLFRAVFKLLEPGDLQDGASCVTEVRRDLPTKSY